MPLLMKIKIYETFLEVFSCLCDYSILSSDVCFSVALSSLKFEQRVVVINTVVQILGICLAR